MKHRVAFGLVATSLLMPAFDGRETVVLGQTIPDVITTVVNANRCYTKEIHEKPMVFCHGGFAGDGGPAASAELSMPKGVAVDRSGNLFISDNGNRRVRRVDAATGIITTVVGNSPCPHASGACEGGFSGDGGPATKAELNDVFGGIALDADGNLFIADSGNQRVRRVDKATGVITTVAGNGTRGFSGDAGPATSAELNVPSAVSVDTSGNLFIADSGNRRVRRVDQATGVITTVAGGGTCCRFPPPLGEERGLAVNAELDKVLAILVDASGTLFIAEPIQGRIRRVDHDTGTVSWVAGGACPPHGGSCGPGFDGDGGAARGAHLSAPFGLVVDGSGNLLIADTGNGRIRRIDHATGVITTIAGSGGRDFGKDGEPATSAALRSPYSIALDAENNLFIAEANSHCVRKVKLARSKNAGDRHGLREQGAGVAH